MNAKIIYSLAILLLLVGQLDGARKRKGKKDKCHLSAVEKCFSDIQSLSKGKDPAAIMATASGLDKICKTQNDAIKCQKSWAKKCGSPLHREVLDLVLGQISNSLTKFCNADNPDRIDFLKESPCIHKNVMSTEQYKKGCNNNYLAALDQIDMKSGTPTADMNHVRGCCAYLTWVECTNKLITEKCGDNAIKQHQNFMGGLTGALIGMSCPKDVFPLDGPECKSVRIVPGTKAKGKLGDNAMTKYMTSFFSYMFITD